MEEINKLPKNLGELTNKKNKTEFTRQEIEELENIKDKIRIENEKNIQKLAFNEEKNQKIYENINKLKDLEETTPKGVDFGLMLSYGESDEYTPAGVFRATGILDENGELLSELPDDLSKVTIEFSEYEYGQPSVQKENGDRIRIPFPIFEEMLRKHSQKNDDIVESILGEAPKSFGILSLLQKAFSDYMAENPEASKKLKFSGEPIENTGVEIVSSNGEKKSTNYTIIPFRFGMTRIMERDNYNKREKGDGDYTYKHMRLNPSFNNEVPKERKAEKPSPGRSR